MGNKDLPVAILAFWLLDEISRGGFRLDLSVWEHFLSKFYELSLWEQTFLLLKLSASFASHPDTIPDKYVLMVGS